MTSKTTTLKAGYRMTVVSWENDGDNYNTCIKEGMSEDEVIFVSKLLSLLDGAHHQGKFGNLYEPNEKK